MSNRTIFFDNDGVLVESESIFFQATREALSTVEINLTQEQYVRFSLVYGIDVWHLPRESGISEAEVSTLREYRDARYLELIDKSEIIIPGVLEALKTLSSQFRLVMVTGSKRDQLELQHRDSGILKYFDLIVSRENYEKKKPHPEPYDLALSRSWSSTEHSFAVEDSPRGVEAALAAGIKTLVVPSELTHGLLFNESAQIFGSLREVTQHIFAWYAMTVG